MDTLPPEVNKLLFDLSFFILVTDHGERSRDASSDFDALFPDFDYWTARRRAKLNHPTDYSAAAQLDVADTIRKIWLLGYPDIATTAKRYLRNLGVQV
jgi:hypothetical protein